MPERTWVFDTVTLSNFLLTDSTFILETRYGNRAIITTQVYDEISSGISEFPALKEIDNLIKKKYFRLNALSSKERKLFLELISHLGIFQCDG